METLKTLIKFGNAKLPKTTAIYNMGSAMACPSAVRGLCELADICYAKIPERIYPKTAPQYRNRQAAYWMSCTAEMFVTQFLATVKRKRTKVRLLRLNESGDFYTQDCVQKADDIARALQKHGIQVYTYTHRSDLDFSKVQWLVVNHSTVEGYKQGNGNGSHAVESFSGNYPQCVADCKKCDLCSRAHGSIIEVLKH